MKDMKKSISCMQYDLNRLLMSGPSGCKNPCTYSLSLKLDKEIVKYYKSLLG